MNRFFNHSKSVAYIGPCPPPIHGASRIHSLFSRELRSHEFCLYLIDTSSTKLFFSSLFTGIFSTISRLKCLLKYAFFLPRASSVYLTLSGGKGQIFDVCVVLLAALLNKPLICHHHSYKYIVQKSILVKLLALAGSSNAMHLFLGQSMRDKFISNYGSVESFCISNLAFMPLVATNFASNMVDLRSKLSSVVISHLSNLSHAKGSHHFIELAMLAQRANQPWKFILAGPMTNELRLEYQNTLKNLQNLEYLGPIDEVAKDDFYKKSTFFIFLSEYKNEAEPLVLLEAISKGAIPIATKVGEIPTLIPIDELLVDRCDLQSTVFKLLLDLSNNNNKYLEYAKILSSTAQKRQEESILEKTLLLNLLSSL